MRILLAEDDVEINRLVRRKLEEEGYSVDPVYNGKAALDYLDGGNYDLAILDIMMPQMDGLTVLRRYRQSGGGLPVLMLTARDSVNDKVTGLDSGADDYLVKPFSFMELLARIRVLLRRREGRTSNVLTVGDLELDVGSHTVRRAGKIIDLPAREFAILEYMMMTEGVVLSRENIYEHTSDWNYEGNTAVITVYVSLIRRKIDDGFDRKLIHTVHGVGYMIRDGL